MRVVIVGATGNVGTSVVQALADEPEVTSVLGLARRPPRWQAPKTAWAGADVVGDDLVPHFRGADAVVHLAWAFQPTHDPGTTWRTNVEGSIRVFEAVARAGAPALVYASSVGAYSPGADREPVDESWPTHGFPTAAYGREKAYVERVLDAFELEHPAVRVVRMRPAFIFKRESAVSQRRYFVGPFLPSTLVRPGLVPILPDLPGLRFQALHSSDAAEAYRRAVTRTVRGPFNLAADPVVDAASLGRLLRARTVRLPLRPVRAAVAAAWHLHLAPASPHLLDLLVHLPVMDSTRARDELGWRPQHSALDAVRAFLDGLKEDAGMDTPVLRPEASGRFRWREIATGVGERTGA